MLTILTRLPFACVLIGMGLDEYVFNKDFGTDIPLVCACWVGVQLIKDELKKDFDTRILYTVELRWLEHLWDHRKLFET